MRTNPTRPFAVFIRTAVKEVDRSFVRIKDEHALSCHVQIYKRA